MKNFFIVAALSIFALCSCTTMTKEQQSIAQRSQKNKNKNTDELVEKLKFGSEILTGTTCDKEINVKIKFTGYTSPERKIFRGSVVDIYGMFYSIDSEGKEVGTNLRGYYNILNGYLRLYGDKTLTLSDFVSDQFGKGERGWGRYKEAQRHRDFSKYTKKFESYIKNNDQHSLPEIPLSIEIIRDSGGNGWIGAFEGRDFKDCREIILANEHGTNTGNLPSITEKKANLMANIKGKGRTDASKLYWLKIAAENGGSFETISDIDQILQKQGMTLSQDYQEVIKRYHSFSDNDDQRAQRALAKMYEEGNVLPKNLAESKRLLTRADTTLSMAAKVCASPKVLEVYSEIKRKQSRTEQGLAILMSVATGMAINPGDYRITEIVLDEVISTDKPFTCSVYGERIGAKFDASTVPDVEYYSVDRYGNYRHIGDNSGDKIATHGIAKIAQNLSNRPYQGKIEIQPQGNKRFNLKSGSDSIKIDLN